MGGLGDNPGGEDEVPAVQASGPESDPQHPH